LETLPAPGYFAAGFYCCCGALSRAPLSQSRSHGRAGFFNELEGGRESTRPRVMISSPDDKISAVETPGDRTSS
jgi:hypothetical protein